MANAPNPKDVKRLNDLYQERINNLEGINNAQERSKVVAQQIANLQSAINEHEKEILAGKKKSVQHVETLQAELKNVLDREKDINTQLEKGVKNRQRNVDIAKVLVQQLKSGWKYLQEQDKIIKSTTLNLGMSGAKAVAMRDSFEQSAGYVTQLGGSIGDIRTIMEGYADETGRAQVMSAEMVKDITNIGKGTGLGIEQATKLGAQFEIMGIDARNTSEFVQGVVDTSERMGVNTTKVLKKVNDNFKKLNTYTFQQGVKGFAQMATYAEKFKIDISDALGAADVASNLEGAIDLAAKLQVMGGEFAKTDPFEMLFLSRNDPAKFTEKIADMTKGLVTFRKMADGSFQKFISPADRDRIASVAESMGMEASALTEIAQRQAEIQKMRQQMGGLGLSGEQKEAIEGAAKYNTETGKFQVSLGGTMMNIRELTKTQAEKFKIEQVLLEERAKQALTFDETFQATINSLKTVLLPLLNGINVVLSSATEFLKPALDWLKKGDLAWAKVAGLFMSAGILWKGILQPLAGRIGGATVGKLANKIGGTRGFASAVPAATGNGAQMLGQGKGAGLASAGKGKQMLGAGAGFGVAMAGAGAGVMMAAKGIGQLADAMSKLTTEQAESLASIVKSLSWFMAGAAIAAVGIMALGTVAGATAVPLLAFGGAILMIGGGIGIAAAGIGLMGEGLSKLVENSKGAGDDMLKVAGGIGMIAASMGLATLGLPGALGMSLAVRSIAKHGDGLVKVGAAFKEINNVMSGSRDDFIAVEKAVSSISNMNTKGGGMLADLANLLKKPLEVKFGKDSELTLRNDITLEIDKTTFMHKIYDPVIAVQLQEGLRTAKL